MLLPQECHCFDNSQNATESDYVSQANTYSERIAMPELKQIAIDTPRLRLRWMAQCDLAALYAIYADPAVTRYWSNGAWTELSQAAQMLEATQEGYRDGTGLRLAIELKETGAMIGTVGLHHIVDASRRCELGYALGSAHWGQGYAGEAVEAALQHAFYALDMNRIEADIDPRNGASARVLERAGFRKEGYMPERWIVNGETADTVFYGLLKRYWDERPAPFVIHGDR
jgi:RimJ/RimL family protein N-acetyltransferase